jgi:hypothetical protein
VDTYCSPPVDCLCLQPCLCHSQPGVWRRSGCGILDSKLIIINKASEISAFLLRGADRSLEDTSVLDLLDPEDRDTFTNFVEPRERTRTMAERIKVKLVDSGQQRPDVDVYHVPFVPARPDEPHRKRLTRISTIIEMSSGSRDGFRDASTPVSRHRTVFPMFV